MLSTKAKYNSVDFCHSSQNRKSHSCRSSGKYLHRNERKRRYVPLKKVPTRSWPGLGCAPGLARCSVPGLWAAELQGNQNCFGGLGPYECSLELTRWELAKINSIFPSCNKHVSQVTLELKWTSGWNRNQEQRWSVILQTQNRIPDFPRGQTSA